MATTYEDTVIDFDLDLLRQPNNSVGSQVCCRHGNQRKSIALVKRKLLTANVLLEKFYIKRDALARVEQDLLESKEQCKNIYIDYKNALQKCTILEKNTQMILDVNKELEERCVNAENRCEASKSLIHQLQQLVKQHENKSTSSIKKETQIEATITKKYAKEVTLLKKEKLELIKDICMLRDGLFGKRKLTKKQKLSLAKYNKYKEIISDDSGAEDSGGDADEFDTVLSPMNTNNVGDYNDKVDGTLPEVTKHQEPDLNSRNVKDGSTKNEEIDGHSECSNGVVSEDTGRASSLEFSDSDKCFHSPEYFIDSPLSADIERNKEQSKLINSSTSPILFRHTVDTATNSTLTRNTVDTASSPIFFVNTADTASSPIFFNNTDVALSPIRLDCQDGLQTREGLEKRIPIVQIDKALSPINSSKSPSTRSGQHYERGKVLQEKQCLEINNSNCLIEESNDDEIEMILDTMRLSRQLITPLPLSPSRPQSTASCVSNTTPLKNRNSMANKMVAELRSNENNDLTSTVSMIAANVLHIKDMLRSRFLNSNSRLCDEINNKSNNHLFNLEAHQENREQSTEKDNSCLSSAQADEAEVHNLETNIENNNVRGQAFGTRVALDIPTGSNHHNVDTLDVLSDNDIHSVGEITETREKSRKREKLTPLDKLKLKMLPKSKIKKDTPPLRKNRLKPKNISQEVTKLASVKSLNNKCAYEKAVKIMADLKLKNQERSVGRQNIKETNCSSISLVSVTPDSLTKLSKATENNTSNKKEKSLSLSPKSQTTRDLISNSNNNVKEAFETRDLNIPTGNNNHIVDTLDVSNGNDIHSVEVPEKCEKSRKRKKRTPLDKLKVKMLPKSKIKKDTPPLKKNLLKPANVVSYNQKVTELANKCAYEKAVKIMADLNLKNKEKSAEPQNNKEINCITVPLVSVITDSSEKLSKAIENNNSINKEKSLSLSPKSMTTQDLISNSNPIVVLQKMNFNKYMKCTDQGETVPTTPNADNKHSPKKRKRRKCSSLDESQIPTKRVLRSSGKELTNNTKMKSPVSQSVELVSPNCDKSKSTPLTQDSDDNHVAISYSDLDVFDDIEITSQNTQEGILCTMIDIYGVESVKSYAPKMSEKSVNSTCEKLEKGISLVTNLPLNQAKAAMDDLVKDMKNWNVKLFISGLMKFLMGPERKTEMFGKVFSPPAPPLTKPEQVLLYVIPRLRECWPKADIINRILNQIEYTLFKLNRTPGFAEIESLSHFYAVLCRYINAKSRLRLFIIDAMYCMQFKAIPLIKQCLEVWMHILPLAHMGIAKSPLVTCLVYLLHYYKCEDKYNRVQELRNILSRKYFYDTTNWNEDKILEMLRASVEEVTDNIHKQKMLKTALIIFAKRNGPKWCQNNIINNMLKPVISDVNTTETAKTFCISVIGPLLKPYPKYMKVHCEIVINEFVDLLKGNLSQQMEEAVISSLIYLSKHNENRILKILDSWKPNDISPELEDVLKDFIIQKPVKVWKTILTKILQ